MVNNYTDVNGAERFLQILTDREELSLLSCLVTVVNGPPFTHASMYPQHQAGHCGRYRCDTSSKANIDLYPLNT